MTTDWTSVFKSLPPEELDKLAVLRIVECSNGVIQHRFRDGDDDAFDREKNKWKGKSCTPFDLFDQAWYDLSEPDDWMYDINGEKGYGSHANY